MIHLKQNNRSINKQSCYLCDNLCSGFICQECQIDLPKLERRCYRCALPLNATSPQTICGQCIKSPPAFSSTQAVFHYRFPINSLLPAIKQRHELHHLNWLCEALLEELLSKPQAWPDVLIPVPSHAGRLFARGFNPPTLIARFLGKQLGIPVLINQLIKVRRTPHQAALSARQRHTNLAGAFSYKGEPYSHVAIVDDIMTTGATFHEISRVLLKCGVQRVDNWVIARTPAER